MKGFAALQCKLKFTSSVRTACLALLVPIAAAGCGDDEVAGPGDTSTADDVEVIQFDTDNTAPDSTADVEVAPGGFGTPCVDNGDCTSGYCIQGADGFECTSSCVEDCPLGYGCKGVTSGSADIVFLCVPNVTTFCRPCLVDRECNGGVCLEMAGGQHCTRPCDTECPVGFTCGDAEDTAGNPTRGCVPTSGTCDCSESTVDLVRGCEITTVDGTCEGVQVCQLDDSAYDWSLCSARIPIAETCDFVDNDCDGSVDEGFVTETGEYASDEHCGYCGNTCAGAIPNAVATCDGELDPAQCVVDTCVAGFFELSPFFCGEVPAKLCNVCDTNESCVVAGALCTSFDDGDFCTVPCTGTADCPDGYTCAATDGGALQCLPTSGTCVCDDDTIGLQRGCDRTQTVGDIVTTCVGLETCAAEGWGECVFGADICDNVDNDCNGVVDDTWVDDEGVYFRDENCGICGNNCSVNAPANATRVCDVSGDVPRCVVQCAEGSADLDGNPLNGCECAKSSDTDLPDGIDQNCDGIDGEIANGVFVARTGNDAGAGTIDDPVLTVQEGIERAATQGKRDVYVATGVYTESIALAAGATVYGGYSGDFRQRDVGLYETALLADQPTTERPGAVNAVGIDLASGLVGFTVFGATPEAAGQSAYVFWIVDSGSALRIADNMIDAGDGAPGALGTAGPSGTPGVPGVAGRAAKDIGDDGCAASDHNLGGSGGPRMCGGVDVGGGTGGAAICPDYNEGAASSACPVASVQTASGPEAGSAGAGAGAGAGGAAGLDIFTSRKFGPYSATPCEDANANCAVCHVPTGGTATGANGVAGATGEHGDAGAGCPDADGAVVDHRWVAALATTGTDGAAGSGGGGGGAAGGVETFGCGTQATGFHDVGGSGGGGGSGGCGAIGGSAGASGGASFAIFVSWSSAPASRPVISGNTIRPGAGGAGGHGGLGGTGGAGGAAGPGGLGGASAATFCAPQGGSGGSGGGGGHGGGGGGGCGGPSFGIFVAGGAGEASWKTTNDIAATARGGAAGIGGPSLGASGTSGLAGADGEANY